MLNSPEGPQEIGAQQEQGEKRPNLWSNVIDQFQGSKNTLGDSFVIYGAQAKTPDEVDTRALIFTAALSDGSRRSEATAKYIALTRDGPFRLLRPQYTPGGDGDSNQPGTMAERLRLDTNGDIPNSGYLVTGDPTAPERTIALGENENMQFTWSKAREVAGKPINLQRANGGECGIALTYSTQHLSTSEQSEQREKLYIVLKEATHASQIPNYGYIENK